MCGLCERDGIPGRNRESDFQIFTTREVSGRSGVRRARPNTRHTVTHLLLHAVELGLVKQLDPHRVLDLERRQGRECLEFGEERFVQHVAWVRQGRHVAVGIRCYDAHVIHAPPLLPPLRSPLRPPLLASIAYTATSLGAVTSLRRVGALAAFERGVRVSILRVYLGTSE